MTLLLDQTPSTILPLELWRQWFGLNPFRFWGLDDGQRGPQGCDDLVRQYPWQASDAASRSDIVQAIAEAEAALTDELGFAPGPRYAELTVPWLPWPRLADHRLQRIAPIDADWRRLGLTLEGAGYIRAVGVEAIALLGTPTVGGGVGSSLAYSDEDGDGLTDTFTVTLTVPTDTDPATVAVYVPAGDRFDGSGRSLRWQVRPIRASLSATTLTVIGRSWTAVRPVLYEGMPTISSGGGGQAGLDPNTTSIYCQSLEVCTRTTDPNGETLATCQAVLEWDSRPWAIAGFCCGPEGTNQADPAAEGRVVARAGIRDAERGIVLPAAAVRNADTGEWCETWPACAPPDRVTVRVYAGSPDRLGGELQQAAALLAAAMVARPICACADQTRKVYDAQFDLTLAGRQDELYSTRDPDLDNPFGPRRGAVRAWKILKRLAQTRAFLLG